MARVVVAALLFLTAAFACRAQIISGSASCSIASVSLSNSSFQGGSASGTVVGNASALTSGIGCGAVSWSITGADAASFQMVGAALETNGSVVGRLVPRSINLVATVSGASNSPLSQPVSITGLFPGQSGYNVGYNASGNPCGGTWAAHNTTFTSGTAGAHALYQCLDVDAGTSGVGLTNLQYIDFKYVRFQSNNIGNENIAITGTSHDITFDYVSLAPRTTFYSSPPGSTWPSAGSGTSVNGNGCTTDVNCINYNSAYQYGLNITGCSGPLSITHSDIWGFGNAIQIGGTTCQITIDSNWIHDGANPNVAGCPSNCYHTDGPGYLNGATPPSNVTVTNNAIASIGNTNALAFQAATSGYSALVMNGNFLSGFNILVDPGHCTSGNTGLQFENNTIGTHLPWTNNVLYCNATTQFTGGAGGTWQGNKFYVLNGTSKALGSAINWTSANDGNFVLPNPANVGTLLSTSDF